MVSTSQIVTAIVAFLGTTIDDLVVLAALFLTRRVAGRPNARVIVAGQYVGFAVVLGVAMAASVGLRIVPDSWFGLLGVVPIAIGVWGLWRFRSEDNMLRHPLSGTVGGIAAITFANGADNITVYTPLFRSLHIVGSGLTALLFLALIGLWCVLGAILGANHVAAETVGRVAHWLVPVVFIVVGALIVVESGVVAAVGHGN
ncbi:cadmium resistance transporter [Nocardia alni]|uniref:cadmium resistance transporter n=1 Tax=Nocardia alni TaxID=2815723 RepID=UPI001C21D6AE|nr:cadmium resistance transporter [Nocardia alni]